jgi:hypothetical protein
LTPQQLEERKEKDLCFNCDNKYSKGHKCGEKKLFYIDYEEEQECWITERGGESVIEKFNPFSP